MAKIEKLDLPEVALLRFVDDNHWKWRVVLKMMNRKYCANYTVTELKMMYQLEKARLLEEKLKSLKPTTDV